MHLANGDIPIDRSRLPDDPSAVDVTVKKMVEMAKGQYGARSAKIRALAINIVNAARVADKDYYGMIVAIHNWVRDQIRYMKDPVGQETLSYPEETAFNSLAGDCLAEGTRVLTPQGYRNIEDVKVGDLIQGRSGWTRVTNWWDKGELPTFTVELDNGGRFVATAEHRCILKDGSEKTVSELLTDDALLGPSAIAYPTTSSGLTEDECYFLGVYLSDGWCDGRKTCIAGKDGFAKEAQKLFLEAWAKGRGWETTWHERYLTIYIPEEHPLYAITHTGDRAPQKSLPDSVLATLTQEKARQLLEGLLVDSYSPLVSRREIGAETRRKRSTRSGTCYSTTSHELAKQARLLFRIAGFSCSDTLVVDHGGLGSHPVHRIYPRYFRDKPARVEAVVPGDVQHVYDLETEDHGIYLPDADVVVHNCDDKTILEMALLGSIGIRSYPVTIGLVQPGLYSHVYLHAIVPTGKGTTHGGETIPLDPIMRDWPVGKEAPASKVKAKKLYTDLSGLPMLDGYADGPDYLDTQNLASVVPVLRGRHTDSAGGPPINTKQVMVRGESTDDMFGPGNSLAAQKNPLKFVKSAGRQQLFARGPMTSYGERNETSYLSAQPVRPMRVGAKILAVRSVAPADVSKTAGAPSVGELQGLADYLGALETQPVGVLKAAAAAHYLRRRAARAHRRHMALKRAVAMSGLAGAGVPPAAIALAAKTDELAQALARKADLLARRNDPAAINGLMGLLADVDAQTGMTDAVMAQPALAGDDWFDDVARKVATVEQMMRDPEVRRAARPMPVRMTQRPRFGVPLSGDTIVHDHNGNELAGFFSSVKKTAKKIADHSIAKKVTDKVIAVHKKAIGGAFSMNKKALLAVGAPGLAKASSKSKQVAAKPGQTYLDANGNPISKAQYDAQMALMKAPTTAYTKKKDGKTSYYLPNGTKITKDQYLAWWRNATNTPTPDSTLPIQGTPIIAQPPMAPSDSSSTGSAMSTSGGTSMPLPSSSTPVDTYGPGDVLSTEDDTSGATATDPASSDPAASSDPGADQGPMTDEDGYLVDANGDQILDANGNPILATASSDQQIAAAAAATPAASAAAPASSKTLGILGLLGGAWYILAHK